MDRGRLGDLMVCPRDSGLGGPGSSLGRGIALCSRERHFTLMVPLSAQVYKWVPVNLILAVSVRWNWHPVQWGEEILLVASCFRNRDKLWPDGPFGTSADFTYLVFVGRN